VSALIDHRGEIEIIGMHPFNDQTKHIRGAMFSGR
jgi:hypothetical protein